MAKKQTRKSISVRGATYVKIKEYAEKVNRSVSDVTEEAIQAVLTGAPFTPRKPAPFGNVFDPHVLIEPGRTSYSEVASGAPRPNTKHAATPVTKTKSRAKTKKTTFHILPDEPIQPTTSPAQSSRPASTPANVASRTPTTNGEVDHRAVKF